MIAFPLLVVQSFIASFTVLVYNITQVTFRQRITPPRLLGRMNASVRFVVWGVMPIASLLSGALGTWLGIVPTMWIGAIGQLLSALFVVAGPFWAMRDAARRRRSVADPTLGAATARPARAILVGGGPREYARGHRAAASLPAALQAVPGQGLG